MERPELKLVTADAAGARGGAAVLFGLAILTGAGIATLAGADVARRPFDPASIAQTALASTLATSDPQPAREAADQLRMRLLRSPLDGASRVVAASLIVETAETSVDRDAAVRQAQAAIRIAPVDEHVAHGAARVLARCGRIDLALAVIARVFDYAPTVAATALANVEPFVPAGRLEAGLKEAPDAWLAWSAQLRRQGREAEADARLSALLSRWPDDLPALRNAASIAAGRNRTDDLVRLVPPARSLPADTAAAPLWAFRARAKALAGDAAGARADAARAVLISNDEPWVLTLAGDALLETEPAAARDYWTRALYGFAAGPTTTDASIWVRHRLARLDDREGRAGDALRGWRTILAARPDDAEAKRRVRELTGEIAR